MQSPDRSLRRFLRPASKLPLAPVATALLASSLLGACLSGGSSDAVTVAGDVPIAYAQRLNTIKLDPLNGAPSAPGGDLMIRELASATAPEHNITSAITQGQGDVQDPEVSWDGKKIAFAMQCPTTNTSTITVAGAQVPACTGHWNIWEYDMTSGGITGGTLRRITASTTADDVSPGYLAAGAGFVFTSNRQTASSVNQALGHSYLALDEYERQVVFNLHTMDLNGGNIQQISFNQSHDRNPVVLSNGQIMYSRWEHTGDRNRFAVFTVNPDGTGLFVRYGDHSSGNSFLHPRESDPSGPYAGSLVSDLMPLRGTQEGGALMRIDALHYSEQDTPANSTVPANGGQAQLTSQALNYDLGISLAGRVTQPYPLWDGTNRILVSYAPCEVSNAGVVVSCSTLSSAQIARLTTTNRLNTDIAADPVKANVPASYSVYMFDPSAQTWRIVASPPSGYMNVKPVALLARPEPSAAPSDPNVKFDPVLKANNMAVLAVRSVYDTDGLGRMGDPVLAASDLPSGCTTSIPKIAPSDPNDTRPLVADLLSMKDPTNTAYRCAPASVLRVVRAIAPPSSSIGTREAIGQTNFEPQQLLGYAPIQPDGSVKIYVPADTPVALSVIDAQGRSFQVHTNWIQARAGEKRTCDGCHGPRRLGALNEPPITDTLSNGVLAAMRSAHLSGESMADTAARLTPLPAGLQSLAGAEPAFVLSADPQFTDIWADTTQSGVVARTTVNLTYTSNASGQNLSTAVPTNGIINYPDHIQPLWALSRPAGSCISCHSDPNGLDLQSTIAGTGRYTSYEKLLVGDPLLNSSGQPVTQVQDGVLVVQRKPALVTPTGSEGDAIGMARKSRIMEILSGQTLMVSADAVATYPSPTSGTVDHSTLLNAAEKRLVAEWIDLGAKYYNDPFNPASGVRSVTVLDQTTFQNQIQPILNRSCAVGCHLAVGSNQTAPAGTSFVENKYVLTGDTQGDFNATLTMITDTCHPATNALLARPSTVPHPSTAVNQQGAVLPVGSTDYNTIAAWIGTGCPTP